MCANGDKDEEEKEENTLEGEGALGGALGLRADISDLCLDSQVVLNIINLILILIGLIINLLLLLI